LEQGQLGARRGRSVVHLGDDRRALRHQPPPSRVERERIEDEQAVRQRVEPERQADRIDEADAGDDAGGDACALRPRQERSDRRFAEQRVAGHGVHDAFGPAGQVEDARNDRLIHGVEAVGRLVDVVEAAVVGALRQRGDGRMARRLEPDLARSGERVARGEGEERGVARAETNDGEGWGHRSHYPRASAAGEGGALGWTRRRGPVGSWSGHRGSTRGPAELKLRGYRCTVTEELNFGGHWRALAEELKLRGYRCTVAEELKLRGYRCTVTEELKLGGHC